MKIKFDLTDEVTITNNTVKVTVAITGVINGQDRPALESSALELANKFFPGASWAFSNFSFQPDGFTFRVQASTRVDASLNDQLEQKATDLNERGILTLQICDTDTSIPLFQKRDAESDLRLAIIEKAKAEASKLGGSISSIEFKEPGSHRDVYSNGARMASYSLESAGGPGLGQSEKIYLSAKIEVDTDDRSQLNG
jgi:hypothetical protein